MGLATSNTRFDQNWTWLRREKSFRPRTATSAHDVVSYEISLRKVDLAVDTGNYFRWFAVSERESESAKLRRRSRGT